MKKITLLFILTLTSVGFSQNLVVNGDFETGAPGAAVESWGGYKNRIAVDDISTSRVGQIENSDGSLFQLIDVTPGVTYDVSFKYRWLSSGGAANVDLVARIKDELTSGKPNLNFTDNTNGYTFNTGLDQWYDAAFSITIPSGVTKIRLLFFKAKANKPVNLDDVIFKMASTASVKDIKQFNFSLFPNPTNNQLNISSNMKIKKIEIFNLIGQKVISKTIDSHKSSINVSQLNRGVYMIKSEMNGVAKSYKFIKQ